MDFIRGMRKKQKSAKGKIPATLLIPDNGFTLLEVMVALAILSIALTSIYRLHGQTMDMSARARFYDQAPLMAQAKLSEIERQDIKNASDGSGDFGDAHPGYAWSISVEEMPSDLLKSNEYHLVRIDIRITLGSEETFQLRTYRFYVE
jgi:general secretion pathway protein I